MMDNYRDSICLALEKALADESVAPIDLPFWFLEAITDNFSDKQQIGSGAFGSVYKGALRNGMVAVKKLHNKIEIQEKDFQREVVCLIDVKHRNIVRFLGYCYETQHKVYQHEGRHVLVDKRNMLFCFEFLRKGSLANYDTGASSGLQWTLHYQIIKGICDGVAYLHQQRIIHMDLKPDNILLDDSMVPRIADFGISRRFSENQSKIITENKVGSLGYMAPEFLKCGRITFKTDIYSLGVIIIEVLMGCKEWPNVDKVLEGWMNTFGTSKSSHLLEQVKVCAEIGIDCMHDDPSKRPDIQDIICRLNETDISEQVPQHPLTPMGEACSMMDLTAIHKILVNRHYRDDEGCNEKWAQHMMEPLKAMKPLQARKGGDFAFRDKYFKAAIDWYTQVVDVGMIASPTVYARRSLCHLMCDQPEAALRDAMEAQRVYRDWPTAFYMQGIALSKLNMQSDATDMFNEASRLEEKWQKNREP